MKNNEVRTCTRILYEYEDAYTRSVACRMLNEGSTERRAPLNLAARYVSRSVSGATNEANLMAPSK